MGAPLQTIKLRSNRKYSLAFKKKAVALAHRLGNKHSAANELKIPHGLVSRWIDQAQAGTLAATPKKTSTIKVRSPTRRRYADLYKLKRVEEALRGNTTMAAVARRSKIPLQTMANWVAAYHAGRLGIELKYSVAESDYLDTLLQRQLSLLESSSSNRETILAEMDMVRGLLEKMAHHI